jgi:hypothetical protein
MQYMRNFGGQFSTVFLSCQLQQLSRSRSIDFMAAGLPDFSVRRLL